MSGISEHRSVFPGSHCPSACLRSLACKTAINATDLTPEIHIALAGSSARRARRKRERRTSARSSRASASDAGLLGTQNAASGAKDPTFHCISF